MRGLFSRKGTCWETGGKILWVPLEKFTSVKTCVIKKSYQNIRTSGTHLYKQRALPAAGGGGGAAAPPPVLDSGLETIALSRAVSNHWVTGFTCEDHVVISS